MFKKLRKKRLSLRSKSKSTSLKDINIVGKFVHQTARIMSASAEGIDSISCHSNSLISILDEVFKPNNRKLTPPTSFVNSSKRNSLFNSCSNRSESTNNSSPRTETMVNNSVHDQTRCIDEQNVDINVISEEILNDSEMVSSTNTNPNHYYVNVDPSLPVQRKIEKHPLKMCYSFNDINIARIVPSNKRSESIQTFTTVDATLSVEIVGNNNPGNCYSEIKINTSMRLISKEMYKLKIITEYKVKKLASKHKQKGFHKNNFNSLLFCEYKKSNIEKIDYMKTSIGINEINSFEMLNYGVLKNCCSNYLKVDENNDSINVLNHADSLLNELESIGNQLNGDDDPLSIKVNGLQKELKKLKNFRSFNGDERSEISELSKIEESVYASLESSNIVPDNRSLLRRVVTHPIVLTTAVIGGLLLLIPTYQKITQLFSNFIEKSSLVIEPLPVEPLPLTVDEQNIIPTYYLPTSLRFGKRGVNVFFSYCHAVN